MTFLSRARRGAIGAALAVATALAAVSGAQAADLTVFAAASLKNALDEIAADYAKETGESVALSFAGSSALARQIQQGAPADVFLSANTDWMDVLEEERLIRPETRVDLLRNRLALIAHGKGAAPVEISPELDLAGMLGEGRLAMGLVEAVPAGIYGQAALRALGLWPSVEDKIAQADNVRAALALVALGAAPLGVVYATDAAASDEVTVIGVFPEDSHPPIRYPAAVATESARPEAAARFLAYLRGEAARAAFERQGFLMIDD